MLVSAIVPTYNHAEFLPQSIESALAQTWPHVEIIVIDDGSTDDTREILEPYESRIRYHYQANGGLGAARNAGLALARGEFIQLLDADDTIEPDKIERQIAPMLDNHSIDIVWSDFRVIDHHGRRNKTFNNPPNKQEDLVRAFFEYNLFQPNTPLIRKRAIQTLGGFDEDRDAQEDWDLWLRMAIAGHRFAYVPGILSTYNRQGSRISRDPDWMYRRYRHMFDKFASKPELRELGPYLPAEFAYRQHRLLGSEMYNFGHWARARRHLREAITLAPDADRPQVAFLLIKAVTRELMGVLSRPFKARKSRERQEEQGKNV